MAAVEIVKRQFHRHERGRGDEDFYYLARDAESGRVFVYHEWSHRRGDGYEPGNAHIELGAFLNGQGTAQQRRLHLIGTLVEGG